MKITSRNTESGFTATLMAESSEEALIIMEFYLGNDETSALKKHLALSLDKICELELELQKVKKAIKKLNDFKSFAPLSTNPFD